MGLLDRPSIKEEVEEIRKKQYNEKLEKELARVNGKAPMMKSKRQSAFKKNVPKKLRQELGERMEFFRSL